MPPAPCFFFECSERGSSASTSLIKEWTADMTSAVVLLDEDEDEDEDAAVDVDVDGDANDDERSW